METQLGPNLTKDCDQKNVFLIIPRVNIISIQHVSLYSHLQNGE